MKKPYVFFLLIAIALPAQAKTVYVINNYDLPLRNKESNKAKIIGYIPIGTSVELLGENSKTGFSHIQLQDGMDGYVAIRNIVTEPPSSAQPETITKNLVALQTENATLKAELAKIKTSLDPNTPLEQSLATERDRLDRELTELKKTATNQIQIKDERDRLQGDVVNVKRELEQLKLENNALKDGANQEWFLYGGILSFSGVLLGFILPKIGWRRRNSWDRM